MTPPLWYGGAYSGGAASGAIDWDTYENGIWQEVENHPTTSFYVTGGYAYYKDIGKSQLKLMTTNQSTWGDYIAGWWSYSARPAAQAYSGITDADAPPYVAVWDCDLGQWIGVEPYVANSYGRLIYTNATRLFNTYPSSKTNNCVFVALTEDPGDISGWRDYDGPDDWDTWEDGIVVDNSANFGRSDNDGVLKSSSSYETTQGWYITYPAPTTRYYNQSVSTGWPPVVAVWNATDNTWVGWYKDPSPNGHLTLATVKYNQVGEGAAFGGALTGKRLIFIYLTREPTNFANWRDYDGPLFASWDEPARHTLFGNTPRASSSTNLSYYEPNPTFFTTISQSGTSEVVPSAITSLSGIPTQFNFNSTTQMNNNTFNTEVVDAAIWRKNYQTPHIYNGWRDDGGPATSGTYKTVIRWHFDDLSYNNWSDQSPSVVIFYDEEIGDTRYWPAYDGPVANWDTYANGVYITSAAQVSSPTSLIQVPAYSSTTYTNGMTSWRTAQISGNNHVPQNYSASYGTVDQDEPPYIAVYITEETDDVINAYASSAKGWYVFKNDSSSSVYNRTTWETPIAWPSDVSTARPSPGPNDSGYLSSGNAGGSFVVFLDEYNDPLGAGGTDHWTRPPFVIYNDAPYINSANGHVYPDSTSAGGTPIIVNDELHADDYGAGMLRDSSASQFRFYIESHSAYGVADLDIYNNGSLYATGTVNLSDATGSAVLSYLSAQSGFSNDVSSDFDTGDGVTGYPIFIIVWTDTDKP